MQKEVPANNLQLWQFVGREVVAQIGKVRPNRLQVGEDKLPACTAQQSHSMRVSYGALRPLPPRTTTTIPSGTTHATVEARAPDFVSTSLRRTLVTTYGRPARS